MSHEVMTNKPIDKRAVTAAIERFSRKHDKGVFGPNQKKYEELIPKASPGPGKQYAFEVDLDKCTGCKACVTACHSENGLDEDETWRSVGLVQGGDGESAVLQNITTACHHCADPACMNGCPTLAYKKDEETGIVKHLDDQCFGCQYCILKCPYDVPKYNKERGIVHKCDMCMGRLKDGQGPACVRACPNGAIRITIVDKQEVEANSHEYVSVPDAPMSDYTYPTTRYKTNRPFPLDMQASDSHLVQPEHSHLPLVFMLTLTQLSVGGFLFEWGLTTFLGGEAIRKGLAGMSLIIGLLALGSSIMHLGRPHLFYRAILGVRKSWLSREIIAFASFAKMAIAYVVLLSVPMIQQWLPTTLINQITTALSPIVVLLGLIGVFTSVMVYRDTRRPFWDHSLTTMKFYLTMTTLGASTAFLISQWQADPMQVGIWFAIIIVASTLIKLSAEAAVFGNTHFATLPMIKKTAQLLKGSLNNWWKWRMIFGLLGGVILPVIYILTNQGLSSAAAILIGLLVWSSCLIGELLSRYLFFRSVVAYKMPGGS